MTGVEIGLGIGLAYGATFGAAATAIILTEKDAQNYPANARNRFSFANRPTDDPFSCDFRSALGLDKGSDGKFLAFNAADVARAGKKASMWWHPDKHNGNTTDKFNAFIEMRNFFMDPQHCKEYDEEVRTFIGRS